MGSELRLNEKGSSKMKEVTFNMVGHGDVSSAPSTVVDDWESYGLTGAGKLANLGLAMILSWNPQLHSNKGNI